MTDLTSSKILACNWKMHFTRFEVDRFFQALSQFRFKSLHKTDWTIFPSLCSFSHLEAWRKLFPFRLGAQNAHPESRGAYTGEVSGPMLRDHNVTSILVGHSERRKYFNESLQTLGQKALSFLGQGFQVIYCLGETLEEREQTKTEWILNQDLLSLRKHLAELKEQTYEKLILAYEPIWAIGTGLVATPDVIADTHKMIQNLWQHHFQSPCPPLLYGGSVTAENAKSILHLHGCVGGLLVGSASLKPDQVFQLLQVCET